MNGTSASRNNSDESEMGCSLLFREESAKLRNTDVESLLFPVEMVNVFFRLPDGSTRYVDTHKAVVNMLDGMALGVVSNAYRLVTNHEALVFAEKCAMQLFGVESNKIEVFNVHSPRRPWYCQVDMVHKGYEVNIGKQEVYLPFLRVTNSYNGSRALRFDIGYCRKLCSNGMIFEKDSIKFRFPHSHSSIGAEIDFRIAEGQLKSLHSRLASDLDRLYGYSIPESMHIPFFFKALELPVAGWEEALPPRRRAYIADLVQNARAFTTEYREQFGPNAYALLNAATDFASNPPQIKDLRTSVHSLQTRAGTWCGEFVAELMDEEKAFNIMDYLGEYAQMAGWRN